MVERQQKVHLMNHSITKMSHLHFTATEEYKNRVIQLGEFLMLVVWELKILKD